MVNIQSSFKDLMHLFFPHTCTGCGSDTLEDEHQLCIRCLSELPITNFLDHPDNPVERVFYGRIPVRNAASAYFFTKDSLIQHLISQLKYRGNKEIGFYLGTHLGRLLSKSERYSSVDLIVPLPLNPKKKRNEATTRRWKSAKA